MWWVEAISSQFTVDPGILVGIFKGTEGYVLGARTCSPPPSFGPPSRLSSVRFLELLRIFPPPPHILTAGSGEKRGWEKEERWRN